MEDLRYPVGRFQRPPSLEPKQRRAAIDTIAEAPTKLRAAVSGLSDTQLDTPYRPEGWTVRQVVHHVPDSHLNAYTRFKLALTEDTPTIKPYNEAAWAELADSKETPIEFSLVLIKGLHTRFVTLLRSLKEEDWAKGFYHPERGAAMSLDMVLAMYNWHSEHHLAHINGAKQQHGM